MFIDGVLRNTVTNAPIPQGMSLYRTFKEKGRVVLLGNHKAKDDRWLRENKTNLVDDLIATDLNLADPEFDLVMSCRGSGPVEMVITADPELAAKLLNVGVTTVMFLHPVYITEKFRPDSRQGAKPWKSIKDEIVRQQETYVEDHRVNDIEGIL
jgi:hypothetical protein